MRWKSLAWILGVLLIGILVNNLLNPTKVPAAISFFMLGCLASIATGYSVVSPRSSPVRLAAPQERVVRHRQYTVGVVISVVIALLFFFEEVRDAPFRWGLVPIILLSPFLIVREIVVNAKGKSGRPGPSSARE